jgi:hypothetical protein
MGGDHQSKDPLSAPFSAYIDVALAQEFIENAYVLSPLKFIGLQCNGVERWCDILELIRSWGYCPHKWVNVFFQRLN